MPKKMQIQEAISLIQTDQLVQDTKTIWADLGCGSGLFTRALAELLFSGSIIYAVDKSISSFQKNVSNKIVIKTIESDFVSDDLSLLNLDGILMANSLHFVKNKKQFIDRKSVV